MNPEKFITIENEPEHLKETNDIQMWLARRMYGEKVHERFIEWKEKYSEKFRMILESEISANPHLLRDWSDTATRDSVLEKFETLLYSEAQTESDAEDLEDELEYFDRIIPER